MIGEQCLVLSWIQQSMLKHNDIQHKDYIQ